MSINFQRGLLSIDDHGEILLYPKDGGMELKLGEINHQDEFEPSALLSGTTEWIEDLKSKLLCAYLGEEKLYHEHPQVRWSDGLKAFIKLENIKPIERDQWVKLDDLPETPMGDQRRYQDEEGLALHGVYHHLSTDQLMLIEHGQSKKQWPWSKKCDQLEVSSARRIVHHYARGWKNQQGQELDFCEATLADMEAGDRLMARVYVGRKAHMQDLAESMEAKGYEVLVRSHQSDEQKFQVNVFAIVSLGKSIKELTEQCSEIKMEGLESHLTQTILEWDKVGRQECSDVLLVELIDAVLCGVPLVVAIEDWKRKR